MIQRVAFSDFEAFTEFVPKIYILSCMCSNVPKAQLCVSGAISPVMAYEHEGFPGGLNGFLVLTGIEFGRLRTPIGDLYQKVQGKSVFRDELDMRQLAAVRIITGRPVCLLHLDKNGLVSNFVLNSEKKGLFEVDKEATPVNPNGACNFADVRALSQGDYREHARLFSSLFGVDVNSEVYSLE